MRCLYKRALAAAVSAGMMLSAVPLEAFAAKNYTDADDAGRANAVTGTYHYVSKVDDVLGKNYEHEERFYYSDEYFSDSASEKNEHLRSMSADLAYSAFGSLSDDRAEHAVDLLSKIGFAKEHTQADDMDITPTAETIGTVISHKYIDGTPVIAVAVRGDMYGAEWASNLDIGSGGDHKGFSDSADKVIERIKAYQEKYSLEDAKFWITGYSRGGAVSDLVGRYITEHPLEFSTADEDVYVYTFEAPREAAEDTDYENIHNVINQNDIIPMVYPEQWGYYNAGTYEYLEADNKYIDPNTINVFNNFEIKAVTERFDSEKSAYVPSEPYDVSDFDKQFVDFLTKNISKENFIKVSPYIMRLISEIDGMSTEQKDNAVSYFRDSFKDISLIEVLTYALPVISATEGTEEYDAAVNSLAGFVFDKLDQTDHSAALTDDQYEFIKEALPKLLYIAVPVIKADFMHDDGKEPLEIMGTIVGNVQTLIKEHIPYNVLPLIKADDWFCKEGTEVARGSAVYYGDTPNEEDLYNDKALSDMGFDDTDIDFISRGFDVEYSINDDQKSTMNPGDFFDKDTLDALKEAVNDDSVDVTAENCLTTYLFAQRTRGYEDAQIIKGEKGRKYHFYIPNENAEELLANGEYSLYYYDTKDYTLKEGEVLNDAISFDPVEDLSISSDEDFLEVSLSFAGTGEYVLVYKENEKTEDDKQPEENTPDVPKDEEGSTPEDTSEEEEDDGDEGEVTDEDTGDEENSDEDEDTDEDEDESSDKDSENAAKNDSDSSGGTDPGSGNASSSNKTTTSQNPKTGTAAMAVSVLGAAALIVMTKKKK